MAQVLPASDPKALTLAKSLLESNELVAIPTETVYGLSANAFSFEAIAKVFEAKDRPRFDPLIVHVKSDMSDPLGSLLKMGIVSEKDLTKEWKKSADILTRAFWPGPLTLLFPKSGKIHDLITNGSPLVAIRSPKHPDARALLGSLSFPLVAPSANRFGRLSPVRAEDVNTELGDRIPLILDGGPCEVGIESTILSLDSEGKPRLLRPGGISIEEIEQVLGLPVDSSPPSSEPEKMQSPGILDSHYSPTKPFYLLEKPILDYSDLEMMDFFQLRKIPQRHIAVLLRDESSEEALIRLPPLFNAMETQEILSESGDPRDAARSLFRLLRKLDQSGAHAIIAEPWLDQVGLGRAIQDRLKRAAGKS